MSFKVPLCDYMSEEHFYIFESFLRFFKPYDPLSHATKVSLILHLPFQLQFPEQFCGRIPFDPCFLKIIIVRPQR